MRLFFAHIALLLITLTGSASEADTVIKRTTRQWTLSSDYTTEIAVPIDTAFNLYHRHRRTDKYSDFNAYPGNYGQRVYQINFFDREWDPDKYLSYYFFPYMYTPSNPLFINTQVPFTEIQWTNGGSRKHAEQTFRVRHSQNINRRLNLGFIYDIAYCLGQYDYQKAFDRNFLFHLSYNGDSYTSYFTAAMNNHMNLENGGVIGEEYLSQFDPADVPVNLNDLNSAQSRLGERYLMLVQRYSPGSKRDSVTGAVEKTGPVTFSYIGIYEWEKHRYFDKYPKSPFYDTVMISSTYTDDSLRQGLLTNTLRVDFAAGRTGRFRLGAGAAVRSELRNFGQVVPGDTLTRPDTIITKQNSLVLSGRIFSNIGSKFGWWATGDLWFQGYRSGDFIVNGRIFKDFTLGKGTLTWDATGTVANYTPSFWYTSFGSNNFSWDFDAGKEFRMTVGTSVSYPLRHMSLSFDYAIIDNYIYMGARGMPSQHEGGLSVASLKVWKDFVVWKLHWDNTVLLQKSSNEDVLDLPLATGRSALFIEHLFRFKSTGGELNTQLGGEVFIHTLYNAMDYNPATGRFFSQSSKNVGNYPFINVFLNVKLKRTRFFIMFDHVNAMLMGYDYYLMPSYPLNVRMFKLGIAWTFYD